MKEKKKFVAGIAAGVIASVLFFNFFAPRYATVVSDGIILRTDRWSGASWRFIDNSWMKVKNVDQEWQIIDQALRQALQISTASAAEPTHQGALEILKEKYPILKKISDDELNERIQIVYSKAILNDMYLSNFIKLQKNKRAMSVAP